MPSGASRHMSPAWSATSAYCPLEPRPREDPRKSIEFLVTNVQSSLRINRLRLQSFQPLFFSHTTCEESPCPRLRARIANSGLRHSSIKSFIPPSDGGKYSGP